MIECEIKEVSIENDTSIEIQYPPLWEKDSLKTVASRKHKFAFLNLLSVILDLEFHGNINFHLLSYFFWLISQVLQGPFININVTNSSFYTVTCENCLKMAYIISR